ncbi:MAG: hypothetical protein ACLR5Y_10220 [Haemophilus parainfluenzae]
MSKPDVTLSNDVQARQWHAKLPASKVVKPISLDLYAHLSHKAYK